MSELSELIGLQQRYTNHSIRVTGVTNLTRGHYTPQQIMSITGHKSIQSLSIYQRVKEDEKMMMGISLMYSLLRPSDVARVIGECTPHFEIASNPDTVNQPTPILPELPSNATPQKLIPATITTPQEDNITVNTSENALVPFNPQENITKHNASPQIDILELLTDGADADLLLVATQIENQICTTSTTTTSSTSIVKKIHQIAQKKVQVPISVDGNS